MKSFIANAIVAGLVLSGAAVADTIYVAQDGSGDYTDIQSAVDAAISGDEIIVGPGTYIGDGDSVIAITNKDLTIKSSVGYAKTIIDGEGVRRCFYTTGEINDGVVDGFTFMNGNSSSGGAMKFGSSADVTLKSCVFRDNNSFGSSYNSAGGAINSDGGILNIESCQFFNNTAEWGAGAVYFGRSGSVIKDCLFEGNQSPSGKGGAVYTSYDLNIVASVFRENRAKDGGALGVSYVNSMALYGCLFELNQAERGGAIFTYAPCDIDSCEISNNTAIVNGGALYALIDPGYGAVLLGDNVICNNTESQIVGNWDDDGGNQITEVCGLGACCVGNQAGCVMTNEDDCIYFGGSFTNYGTDCIDANCPGVCLGDANGDGEVSANDILIVIAQWGVTCP